MPKISGLMKERKIIADTDALIVADIGNSFFKFGRRIDKCSNFDSSNKNFFESDIQIDVNNGLSSSEKKPDFLSEDNIKSHIKTNADGGLNFNDQSAAQNGDYLTEKQTVCPSQESEFQKLSVSFEDFLQTDGAALEDFLKFSFSCSTNIQIDKADVQTSSEPVGTETGVSAQNSSSPNDILPTEKNISLVLSVSEKKKNIKKPDQKSGKKFSNKNSVKKEISEQKSFDWLISSVDEKKTVFLCDWIRKKRPLDRIILLSRSMIPVQIDVDFPEKVGLDRLVAAFAGSEYYWKRFGTILRSFCLQTFFEPQKKDLIRQNLTSRHQKTTSNSQEKQCFQRKISDEPEKPLFPIMIVDAGTAITIDILTLHFNPSLEQGVFQRNFQGGAILPGISMLAQGLHQKTSALPAVCAEFSEFHSLMNLDSSFYPGKQTETAISVGIQAQILGSIRLLYDFFLTQCLLSKPHQIGRQYFTQKEQNNQDDSNKYNELNTENEQNDQNEYNKKNSPCKKNVLYLKQRSEICFFPIFLTGGSISMPFVQMLKESFRVSSVVSAAFMGHYKEKLFENMPEISSETLSENSLNKSAGNLSENLLTDSSTAFQSSAIVPPIFWIPDLQFFGLEQLFYNL